MMNSGVEQIALVTGKNRTIQAPHSGLEVCQISQLPRLVLKARQSL
jgi:hypothetical protein